MMVSIFRVPCPIASTYTFIELTYNTHICHTQLVPTLQDTTHKRVVNHIITLYMNVKILMLGKWLCDSLPNLLTMGLLMVGIF